MASKSRITTLTSPGWTWEFQLCDGETIWLEGGGVYVVGMCYVLDVRNVLLLYYGSIALDLKKQVSWPQFATLLEVMGNQHVLLN